MAGSAAELLIICQPCCTLLALSMAVSSFPHSTGALCCAEEVRKDRKKAAKNDAVVRLASAIHKVRITLMLLRRTTSLLPLFTEQNIILQEGKEGVEAAYEKTSQFHEAWKVKARDMIAQNEWRKRKLTKRVCILFERLNQHVSYSLLKFNHAVAQLKEEQLRIEEDSAERGKRFKVEKEHHKEWEKTREGRVGTWRDFAKKGKSKVNWGFWVLGGIWCVCCLIQTKRINLLCRARTLCWVASSHQSRSLRMKTRPTSSGQ